MEIRILGPGCARCDLMTKEVIAALSEMGVAAGVEHVTDIREIVKYRVMGSPALVINGRVVSVGQVPDRGTIKKRVTEAAAKGRGGSEEKPFRDRGR
ncbi:MAG: thioredoxin family protein [Syntrophaceae bacterium]|nr:thioredoxin family protein [Syntrophaceae bacterium]